MNFRCLFFTCAILLAQFNVGFGAALAGYGGDPDAVSTSGISAGGAMASQFHVAFSSEIIGCGIVAGLVYHCAEGSLSGAELCMYDPTITNVKRLETYAENSAEKGDIDDTANLEGSKVYIFDGTRDTVVYPKNGKNTEEFYNYFGADILTEYDIVAEHCMPTVNYGNECQRLGSPFIGKCDYNGAYILLNHIYGNLIEPTGTETSSGQLIEFDQSEFITGNPSSISMADTGYIYVPSNCSTTPGCKVHLAFHGCEQGSDFIDDEYVRNAGYNEVADLNNIIIIYPQAVRSFTTPSNPNGCFDWWSYTKADYALKSGVQMAAIHDMLARVLS